MIQRSDVRSLIRTGAMQLGAETVPANFDAFYNAVVTSPSAVISQAPKGSSEGDIAYELGIGIGFIEVYAPEYIPVIRGTLQHAGYRAAGFELHATANAKLSNWRGWHRDYVKGEPGKHGITGFSILVSVATEEGLNHLRTGGRSVNVGADVIQTHDYADGPVVIAQMGFGYNEGDDFAVGPTWHTGNRTIPAKFVAIDIKDPIRA